MDDEEKGFNLGQKKLRLLISFCSLDAIFGLGMLLLGFGFIC